MSNFNSLRFLFIGLFFLTAACGPEPRSADAQDLSVMFHRDKAASNRAQVRRSPARTFSADDPARILVIGDSLAQGFGIFLDRRVKERNLAAIVTNRGRTSTGLSRSDFYDWPSQFDSMAASLRPDIIVAHFGSNDNQSIIGLGAPIGSGTAAWDDAYRSQTRRILDIAARYDTMVYLLGPAPDRSGSLNRHLSHINPIFREEAEAVQAHYMPLSAFAAGENGEYITTTSIGGRSVTIRSGDGSHFTGNGYYLVADKLLEDMAARVPTIFAPKVELAGVLQ